MEERTRGGVLRHLVFSEPGAAFDELAEASAQRLLDGVLLPLFLAYHAREGRRFDRARGVETTREARAGDLSFLGGCCDLAPSDPIYQPTPLAGLRAVFRVLPDDLRDFTFLDLGAGKGRALLFAAERGCRRVIGVDAAAEMVEICRGNLERYRTSGHAGAAIEIHHQDAAAIPIPDGPCVIFLFNPFGPQVLARVVANLAVSWRGRPRPLLLVYYNPIHAQVVDSCRLLRRRAARCFPLWPALATPFDYVVYETPFGE